ncbi:MAG: PA0069 family radical SAM protein [Pseudomonadota bacterium]
MEAINQADIQAFGSDAETSVRRANHVIDKAGMRLTDRQVRGRASQINPTGRFEPFTRAPLDDGWQSLEELPPFKTDVQVEHARSAITRNQSPDVPFDRSVNPYRGCEHGCVYCFARPSHTYQGLSAGLDFEAQLFAKPDLARVLEKEITRPGYEPKPIAIGTNTDPYQPIEKDWMVMRSVLEVLERYNHPVMITTKGAMIQRDIDILERMAANGLASVMMSVTTMDRHLARTMEPRASTPTKRLETIRALSEAGIPTGVLVAPIIPGLNDHEIEKILDAAAAQGALYASHVILRLPLEVAPIFKEWLLRHYPERYRHVLSLVRSMRGGKDYDANWSARMKGTGPYAWQISRRMQLATKRLGLTARVRQLRTDLFSGAQAHGEQLALL